MQNLVYIIIKLRIIYSTIRKESSSHGTRVVFYNNTINNTRRK
jgi:hypothetical protein